MSDADKLLAILEIVTREVEEFDVDGDLAGDLCDYAYSSVELFKAIESIIKDG